MKSKKTYIILCTIFLLLFGLNACTNSKDIEESTDNIFDGIYSLGGIVVNANSVNEYFVDPNDMSYSEQNAYKQKISDYGTTINVKGKTIDFDGLVLAQYNSANYSMSGRNIVFSDLSLKIEFTYATFENGVLSLCYNKDLNTPIVFEYYSTDYVAPSYKIIFDYGKDDNENEVAEKAVQLNTTIGELPKPQLDGYTFSGWTSSYNAITEETKFKWKKDITLNAVWKANTYNVTYEYNEATGENYYEESKVSFNSYLYELPTPYKTGYTFGGWFTEQNGAGQEIKYNTVWTIADNVTLYAKWVSNEFSIAFDYQGAQGNQETQTVYYKTEIGELPRPTKEGGNTFGGWFTEVGGGGEEYIDQTVFAQTKNVTLYAKWNTSVAFDYSGATSVDNETENLAVVYNAPIAEMPRPHKDGYSFDGWYNGDIEYRTGFKYLSSGSVSLKAKWVEGTDKENFTYTQSDKGVTITGFSEKGKNLSAFILPNRIDNKATIGIASNAFSKKNSLQQIILPNSLLSIGDLAFEGTNLGTVVLPESVTSIGSGAFLGCPLTEITIPFLGRSIKEDEKASSTFGYIFGRYSNTDDSDLIWQGQKYYTWTQAGGYYTKSLFQIPKTLTKVTVTRADGLSEYGFYNCTMLTEIVINSEITTIPSYVFYNCTDLEILNSIAKVDSVGISAFENCRKFVAVNDIKSLKAVEEKAFAKTPLNTVTFADTIKYIGTWAFEGTNLGTVVVPESVTSIGRGAFLGCPLTEITIPFVGEDINSIGEYSRFGYIFGRYSNATSSDLTSQAQSQSQNYLFQIPKTLTKVTVTRVDGLSESGFYNCTMLNEIVINSETKTIPERAFYNCGIINFTIPDGVTTIARGAFENCKYLETIGVPLMGTYNANNHSYLNYLFGGLEYNSKNCVPSQLKTVIVTGDATAISPYAFYNCTNLNFITVDHEIVLIGQQAFKGCASLKAITLNSFAPALGKEALAGIPDDMILRVSDENKGGYQTEWDIDQSRIFGQDKSYVMFESRGGSSVDTMFVANGDTIEEPTAPRRSNYIFLGWYRDIKLKNKFDFDTPIDGDIALYAKWKNVSIALDTEVTIDMNTYAGETYYFTFKPETSGYFTIRSYGTLDTTGFLYNSSGSLITSNTNGGTGVSPNFLIRYQLTAGTTYIIGVKLTSATATGEFSVMISNG